MSDHTKSAISGAAEEAEFDAALEDTFVTTSDGRLILSGRKSIVRAPKVSGKSALKDVRLAVVTAKRQLPRASASYTVYPSDINTPRNEPIISAAVSWDRFERVQ